MRQRVNGPTTINSSRMGKKAQNVGIQPLAPAVFNKNKNSALCLPLLSETQKIIWVHSDEIKIPAEKAAKLDEAFTRFPYLTKKQILTLAQQCSLHPFLVKSWFMAQRLLYGISWDSKDIQEIRRTMLGKATSKIEQFHGRETPGTSKEINSEALPRSCTKPEMATLHKSESDQSFSIPDESLDKSALIPSQGESSGATLLLAKREKEQMETSHQPPERQLITQSSQTGNLDFPPTKKKRLKKRYPLPRCTPKQLSLMKTEFIKSQYPAAEQYLELSSVSGIPRTVLVQWFNDMRYVIKKTKPRWMTVEQHVKAVANIKREQCIRKKMQKK